MLNREDLESHHRGHAKQISIDGRCESCGHSSYMWLVKSIISVESFNDADYDLLVCCDCGYAMLVDKDDMDEDEE